MQPPTKAPVLHRQAPLRKPSQISNYMSGVNLQAVLQNNYVWSARWAFFFLLSFPCSLGLTVQRHFVLFTPVFCSVRYTFVPRGLLVQTPTRVCIKSLVSRKRGPPRTIQQNPHQKELSSTYCPLITSDCEIESHGSSMWLITLINPFKLHCA